MNTHHRWTQSDITELRSRLELGTTVRDIADALKRPPDEVSVMMTRLRLRRAD